MKTVQDWLREANAEEVIGTFLCQNPMDPAMIEDKDRTVAEILDTAKIKLRSLIQYLLSLNATRSDDGVFFASHTRETEYPEVCAVLSMRKEIMETELPQSYGWEFTPWEKLMGYVLADTKLTADHTNTILSQILQGMTFFGLTREAWEGEIEKTKEALHEAEMDSESGKYYTAEEVFAEFHIPRDEPDEIADELNRRITQAKLEYSQHCLKREAAKVRKLLEGE